MARAPQGHWLLRLLAIAAVSAAVSGCAACPPVVRDALTGQRATRQAAVVAAGATQTVSPRASLGLPTDLPESVAVDPTVLPPPPTGESAPPAGKDLAAEPAKKLFTVDVRGRIQAEAALANQSTRDQQILGTIEDGVGFRRARLGAQGTIGEQVRWVAEWDFAGGNVAFKDVYLAVENLPVVREVRIGNFCEPFSLEGFTSSNVIPFVERSPTDALDPARHWGACLFSYTDDQRATLQAGIFRSGSNNTGNDLGNGNDMQYTARITGLPWYEDDGRRLLHLGGAFSQQWATKTDTIVFNQGLRSNLLIVSDNPGSPFEPIITVNASQQQLYNLQAAVVLGPVALQAEWDAAYIHQLQGGPVFYHGSYVQGSWFVTGENREYLTRYGVFGGPKVQSPFLCLRGSQAVAAGPGAWELTARFAYMDFFSNNLPPNSSGLRTGNRDSEITLGVNWYLNDNTRLMFNFVHAVPVDPNFGPSWANAFFLSAQVFW